MKNVTQDAFIAAAEPAPASPVNAIVIGLSDLYRVGIRSVMNEHFNMNAVYDFTSPEQLAIAGAAIAQKIDVIIIDEDEQALRSLHYGWMEQLSGLAGVPVVAIASRINRAGITDMLRRGARACIGKSHPLPVLVEAVRAAMRQQWWVPEEDRGYFSMADENGGASPVLPAAGLFNSLTAAEKHVVKQILCGMTMTEIALYSGKSVKTVSGQKISAMRKLDVRNVIELNALLTGISPS